MKGNATSQGIWGIRGTVEVMTDGHLALIKVADSVGKHGTYKSNN